MRPLAIDLYCGLGGWTEGLLAEGYHVIGYDITQHVYGAEHYPSDLVIQDVLTLHGARLKDAALIVASPVCTEFSYMAMPWKRAKQIGRALRGEDEFPEDYRGSRTIEDLTAQFNACFRIQREASEARGHKIPMVVENVRGAQPWVGRAAWNYGSYYLWGDVPALMPIAAPRAGVKVPGMDWSKFGEPGYKAVAFNDEAIRQMDGRKVPGFRFDGSGHSFQTAAVSEGRKGAGAGAEWFDQNLCQLSSKSSARKAASAQIAKIPLTLSRHIAAVYRLREVAA